MTKKSKKQKLVGEEVGILAADQDEVIINHFYHYGNDSTQTDNDDHEGGDVEVAQPAKKKRQTKAQKKAAAQAPVQQQSNQKIYEELAKLSALSPAAQACVANILNDANIDDIPCTPKEEEKKVKKATPKKRAQKKAQEIEDPQIEVQDFPESSTADQTAQSVQKSNTQLSYVYDPNNQLDSIEDFTDMLNTWKEPLENITCQNYFTCMFDYMKEQYSEGLVLPHKNLIFNAFKQCEFDDIKVVIVGAEPYMQPGYANGLCFSVQPSVNRIPQTLKQIYKALDHDDEIAFSLPEPMHGDLTHWANQGVLLLNEILTCRSEIRVKKETKNKKNGSKFVPFTHKKKGWENFTRDVLQAINDQCENVVFICFGIKAAEMIEPLIDQTKNLVIKERHPSLQVPVKNDEHFWKTKTFSQCNNYLEKNGKCGIDWNL